MHVNNYNNNQGQQFYATLLWVSFNKKAPILFYYFDFIKVIIFGFFVKFILH